MTTSQYENVLWVLPTLGAFHRLFVSQLKRSAVRALKFIHFKFKLDSNIKFPTCYVSILRAAVQVKRPFFASWLQADLVNNPLVELQRHQGL
jgi:hypothetical protein